MVYASLFGVGAPEALVIGVVALLVFGPKGLAEVSLIDVSLCNYCCVILFVSKNFNFFCICYSCLLCFVIVRLSD